LPEGRACESVFAKSVHQMESGMSKIDEVMEIKALRRVISAYLKFVFSVFFLLCFVFIKKKFRHSKSVTECVVVVVVIVASVLIE
jgi:hypothetical protein